MIKKLFVVFILLLFYCGANAQVYQLMPQYGYRAKRMIFDSTLQIPTTCSTPTLNSNIYTQGAIAIDSCNNSLYFYNPKNSSWGKVLNVSDSSAFPIATFGGGSGAAGDTSAFTTSAYYGSFYNSPTDTIVVTAINKAILVGSVSDTLFYNSTFSTSGATAISVGTKIPPGNYVFSRTPAITTKPTYLSITLIGYRKRP